MELNFRPVGKQSQLNGQPFNPGDEVTSYLFRSESTGTIDRLDVHCSDERDLVIGGPVICRWTQRIRQPEVSEADQRRQDLLTTEELFLALCQGNETGEPMPERDTLLSLLALKLERKRVLRSRGNGRYLHVKSKVIHRVPEVALSPERLLQIQDKIGQLL